MHDDDDNLIVLNDLMTHDLEQEQTLQQRLKEWAIIGFVAVTMTVIVGLAGIGAATLLFAWALS